MAVWIWVAIGFIVLLFLLALAARYNVWRPARSLRTPRILMYHSIRPMPGDRGDGIVATPAQFAWQLDWIRRHGGRFVTVSELLAADDPSHMVAVTFDDGYRDNHDHAWPILKRFDAPATIYLAPDMPDIDALTPQMIQSMVAGGIEFGAHTLHHCHLPSTSDEQARTEIAKSRERVEALTGQPCRSFAYPYGKFADRHVEMVREAGFDSAVTTKKRIRPLNAVDRWRLPRLSMVGQMNRFEFWLTFTRGRYRV